MIVETSSFIPSLYATFREAYLLACLRDLPRPVPWGMLKEWADDVVRLRSSAVSFGDLRVRRAVDLAAGVRDRNIARHWKALRRIGLEVVDRNGDAIVDELRAIETEVVQLQCPAQAPLRCVERIGFFTHSLVGNALLLLFLDRGSVAVDSYGREIFAADVARAPNRNHLENGTPMVARNVVLIRHCRTEANERGILLGRSDGIPGWGGLLVDRTPRECPSGVRQWHCSSLARTLQTALVFGVQDPTVLSDLDEMDIGIAEGLLEQEGIRGLVSVRLMYIEGDPFAAITDERGVEDQKSAGECFVEVLLRVHRCLTRIEGILPNP